MVFDLFLGAVLQVKKRALHLQEVAVANPRPDLRDIQRQCLERLKNTLADIDLLISDIEDIWRQDASVALDLYRHLSDQVFIIERNGVFSLIHSPKSDAFLTRLTQQVCSDIGFPVLAPTVSQTSRTHYRFERRFNLMFVPPLESRFLLHLPDLYHELCHPLFSKEYNQLPNLKPFRTQFSTMMYDRSQALTQQMQELDRREGPAQEMVRLNAWLASWAPDWLEEFYCDLFAIFTLGPAYAWSNCHLCLKLPGNPFATPSQVKVEHPPNAARMNAMLMGLRRLGFDDDADRCSALWINQVQTTGHAEDMAFRQCFPDVILEEVVSSAFKAFEDIGLKRAEPSRLVGVALCLNQAWDSFWADPEGFGEWETKAVEHLQRELSGGVS